MNYKLPTHIIVGNLVYQIEESADICTEGSVFGSTHHKTGKIFLDPDQSE